MAEVVGAGIVPIRPDLTGFTERIAAETNKATSAASAKMATLAKAAVAGLAVGAAGAGALLLKVGSDFDAASDTIRVGTGATGEALKSLEGGFKNVIKNVPADFGSASTAIADLNTRLGLTGKPLEGMASQMLELSRITGTDLGTNIAAVSRAFGDWGVTAENQGASLDSLFRAAQASGATVDQLAEGLVKFGSPLRQLGFSMGKSTALLGAFEQQGVNSELVMGSLRIALGKMAKAGEKDLPAALEKSMEAIKNAGTAGEASAMALELFGARAGPDMAAAIREGRFELGAIYDAIGEGEETILSAAADTEDFAEKWTKLKNRVFVAIQPVATKFFDLIGKGMDRLPALFAAVAPTVRTIALGFRALFLAFRDGDVTSDGFVGVMERIGNVLRDVVQRAAAVAGFIRANFLPILAGLGAAILSSVVPAFVAWATTAASAAIGTLALAAPAIAMGAGLAALAAGVVYAYKHFEVFRNVVDTVLGALSAGIGGAVAYVKAIWPQVSETISHVVNVAGGFIRSFVDVVSALWRAWGDDLARIATTAFGGIRATVENVVRVIQGVIQVFLAVLNGDWGRAWEGVKAIVGAAWDQIKNIVGTATGIVRSLVGGLASTVAEVAGGMWEPIRAGFKAVINWVIRAWNGIKIPGFDIPGPGPNFPGISVPQIKELAEGGRLRPGELAFTGERGVELIRGGMSGNQVFPNDQLLAALGDARQSAPTYSVTVNGSSEPDQAGRDVVFELRSLQLLLDG